MPGSPAFSAAMFRQRVRALFHGVDWNIAVAFWLFGTLQQPYSIVTCL